MDICLHHVAKRVIHHTVAFERSFPSKRRGDDGDIEVTKTILCTSMSRMQVTLVFHLQMRRRECLTQQHFDARDTFDGHGRTFLNGLTVTLL